MRHAHWTTRLHQHIERHRAEPFAWGLNDCCTFARGAVAAVTGAHLPLPAYGGWLSAARHLRLAGGLAAAADRVLPGLPAVTLARRGDVLLLCQAGRQWLAVCLGHLWAAPGARGLVFGPALDAHRAWRVE